MVPKAALRSVALATTVYEPAVVAVPLIVPVVALIVTPAGSPVADQVNFCSAWLSVAEAAWVAALPLPLDLVAIAVTVTVLPARLLMVHVNDALATAPSLVVDVTFTGDDRIAAFGVPEINPVDELMVRPPGRPVAE